MAYARQGTAKIYNPTVSSPYSPAGRLNSLLEKRQRTKASNIPYKGNLIEANRNRGSGQSAVSSAYKGRSNNSSSSSSSSRSGSSSGGGEVSYSASKPKPYKASSFSMSDFNMTDAPEMQSMNSLRNQYNNIQVGGSPDLPDQIDMDDYDYQEATIKDLQDKYGFDYSRDYAARIAEAQAQAQRDEITNQRERINLEQEQAETALGQDYFQQYLQQRQDLANNGINAGLANERDIRLEMSRQGELADIYADANQSQRELDRSAQQIERERVAQEDQLFQERLNTAFQQAMTLTGQRREDAMNRLNAAIQLRNQAVDEAWREYENNSMSVSEYEQYLQNIRQQEYQNAFERWQTENQTAYNEWQTRNQSALEEWKTRNQLRYNSTR